MASVGHVVVGLAAARWRAPSAGTRAVLPSMLAWSALSLSPDLDVAAFALRIPYAGTWGHRGAVHSLAFAVAGGIAAGLLLRAAGARFLPSAVTAVLVLASHGLLDALTDGGLGVALAWPFSHSRYFFPWHPVPVAPIGRRFVSAEGLSVALRELALFSPLLLHALWRRPPPRTAD